MALCQQLNQTSILDQQTVERLKTELISSSKGKSLGLFLPFYCEYGTNIHVGKECFINYHCTFLDVAPVTLGDNVWLGSGVTIATPCHPFLPKERLAAQYPDGYHDLEYAKPVTIERTAGSAQVQRLLVGSRLALSLIHISEPTRPY